MNREKRLTSRSGFLLLTIMLVTGLALASCGSSSDRSGGNAATDANHEQGNQPGTSSGAGRTVVDALGNEVTIPEHPSRIIAAYLEDHLVTLGVKPAAQWSVPNGMQDYLQPAGLEGVPTISYNLPLEEVMNFDPDLILIGSSATAENGMYAQYAKIAPTYVLGDDIAADWRAALTKIGEVLGLEDKARQALDQYDAKVRETKAKLGDRAAGKSAAILWLTQKQFYIVDNTTASGAVVYGDLDIDPPNLIHDIPADARAAWNPVTLEKLAELDADYILLVNSDTGQTQETLSSALWQAIPAVRAGQVYEMDTKSSWLYNGAEAGSRVMDDLVSALSVD